MNWKQALSDERIQLRRIIALLLALADLAERASRRSRAACALMLWILHPAAAVVLVYLDDRAEVPFRSGDVRDDLLAVALCFRQLALVLSHQARIGFSSKDAGEIKAFPRVRIPQVAAALTRHGFVRPVLALNTS